MIKKYSNESELDNIQQTEKEPNGKSKSSITKKQTKTLVSVTRLNTAKPTTKSNLHSTTIDTTTAIKNLSLCSITFSTTYSSITEQKIRHY